MNPGEKLDRFDIRQRIHVGAVAEVYLAWDPLRQVEVILKVLRTEHVYDESFMKSFRRELSISMLLDHPCIVPVRDIRLDGEHPFFSMPYYAAGSLKERLQEVKAQGKFLSLDDARVVMRGVTSGLDSAHTKEYDPDPDRPGNSPKRTGILHRDVKPSNTFIELNPDRTIKAAYLADFGIAHAIGGGSITRDTTGGTAPYFSPEIGTNRIEGRSDLYSHAVMMFEVLTNELPIQPAEEHSLVAWIRHHAEAPPRNARAIRPELPETVNEFFRIALAKRAEDRYPNGRAMAEAFEAALNGRRVLNENPAPTVNAKEPGSAVVAESAPLTANKPATFKKSEAMEPVRAKSTDTKRPNNSQIMIGAAVLLVLVVGGGIFVKAQSDGSAVTTDATKGQGTPSGGATPQTIDLSLRVQSNATYAATRHITLLYNNNAVLEAKEVGSYLYEGSTGSGPGKDFSWKTYLRKAAILYRGQQQLAEHGSGMDAWPTRHSSGQVGWIYPPVTLNQNAVIMDQSYSASGLFSWAPNLSWKAFATDRIDGRNAVRLAFSGWPPTSKCLMGNSYLGVLKALDPKINVPVDGWVVDQLELEVDSATGIPLVWKIRQTNGSNLVVQVECKMKKA